MIKRDTIQRIIIIPQDDGQGGSSAPNVEYKENLTVNVSLAAIQAKTSGYGTVTEMKINVVANNALDDYINARYIYSGRVYKLIYQVKIGNEWHATLSEVNEQGVSSNVNNR